MPSTSFDPATEGFQFSNAYIQWTFGPLSSTQLCGGMCYAALDYYNTDFAIPRQKDVPVEKSTLHTYIYNRQWDAHQVTVPRFVDADHRPTHDRGSSIKRGREVDEIHERGSPDSHLSCGTR
ncbi:MAG: hypothetical protein FJ267_08695 [Planctomycetes bacterium]|nr:hypothetical protein [Planctomycetota bacterium]